MIYHIHHIYILYILLLYICEYICLDIYILYILDDQLYNNCVSLNRINKPIYHLYMVVCNNSVID